MTREEFEKIIAEEFPNAIPRKFRGLIKNVVFMAEDEPTPELRAQEGLADNETLLGFYHGIPNTARGDLYGIGMMLPDTITLFQKPIEMQTEELQHTNKLEFISVSYKECVRQVVRETIWHEVAHHFGFDENQVRRKEKNRKNRS